MSVHHEYDVISYTPEQDQIRRCFIARVAIQQWLTWEKNPQSLEPEEVEERFAVVNGWLDEARPMLNVGGKADIERARHLFRLIEAGVSQRDKPHELSSIHRIIGGAILRSNDLSLQAPPLAIHDVSKDIRFTEPQRSIFLADALGWNGTDIEEGFGVLKHPKGQNMHDPIKIKATFAPKLERVLGEAHPELAALHRPTENSHSRFGSSAENLVDDFEQYLEIPQYVYDKARKLKGKDAAAYVVRYLNGMLDCRDIFIPDLRKKHGYNGTIPLASIRASCYKSPDSYRASIEEWFTGSLAVIAKLQEYGNLAYNQNITSRLVHYQQRLNQKITTIDQQALSRGSVGPNFEKLGELQDIIKKIENRHNTQQYRWDVSVLAYAIKRYSAREDITDELAKTAAVHADYLTKAHINSGEGDIELLDQVEVALGYIDNVKALEKQGVSNAEGVARYHGPRILSELFDKYAPTFLPRTLIKRQLSCAPFSPEKRLFTILNKRDELAREFEIQGYDIDMDALTYLAEKLAVRRTDVKEKVSEFLTIYEDLLDAYETVDNFEKWMAARAIVRYPKNPAACTEYYIYLMRKGLLRQGSTYVSNQQTIDTFEKIASEHPVIPSNEQLEENVSTMLDTVLTPFEVAAVRVIFELAQAEEIDEVQLAEKLGVDDLENHVMTVIIPKLQSSNVSLSDFL